MGAEDAMQQSPDDGSLGEALALMRDLRKRCEWDAAQTHESLRPYLIEEAYEVDDAIRGGDDRLLREELGDLLLQVLFHSVVAEERGAFDMDDGVEERSEEHTSELQSRQYLVCRLLLEKKKKNAVNISHTSSRL